MVNPLLETSKLKFGAVAFDRIRAEQFVPALTQAMTAAKAAVERIKADPAAPNFANTFVSLEATTAQVYDIAYIYSNLRSAHGDEAMQALAKKIMPMLMALESDINLDADLFARVQTAHDGLAGETLSAEERTLAERTYRSLRRNGGLLDAAGKAKLRALDEELSVLGPKFSEHVLKATNAFELVVTDPADLAGLPASAIEAAEICAKDKNKGKAGSWVFTLQAPSVLPFLKYAERRELRRQVWTAYNARAYTGPESNQTLVKRIAVLRYQRAQLLGYESHAHFQMEERMAEHPDTVRAFLTRLLGKSKTAGERELAELQQFMQEHGATEPLQPWDYPYWAHKLKESRYQLNAEEMRPYFPLGQVLNGAFACAARLFDLEFKPTSEVPVYAQDVQVFEVVHKGTGEYMGLFYADFHPRATKGGGAWCTRFKGQYRELDANDGKGAWVRPHVSIVCNFSPPSAGKPSLLTFQEVSTLFHEFGHALHSLLSRCTFRSLSCTNVYRDFVELPSQLMENWAKEPEGLALFARHYETGATIPAAMVEKIIASENFHAAYMMLRQLRFGFLDLAWYGSDPSGINDVAAFEHQATAATELLPTTLGTNISCAFEHIFSGGYSAGYYGYKWAEVLDADAFEFFKEEGIFSRKVADLYRTEILERGGSEHPMQLYKSFRGRAPDPDALLRRSQLI